MSTFDVVGGKNEEIDRISFSIGSFSKDLGRGMILEAGAIASTTFRVTSKQHAEYMISAIKKAIELGWFDNVNPESILSSRSPNVPNHDR